MENPAARFRFSNDPHPVARSLILYDGICHLCNGFVRFIIKRDPQQNFQFGYLQSDSVRRILEHHAASPEGPDSVILIEGDKIYTRSTAALRIARRLRGGWPLCYGLIILPAWIRDSVYDLVGRHRYRLFGKSDACILPAPEHQGRFLDGG